MRRAVHLRPVHTSRNVRVYLAMVDEPDGHPATAEQDAERAAAHNARLKQRCNEDFPGTPNRVQAHKAQNPNIRL